LLSSYNTLFVGKVCHSLKKVESTNDFAMKMTKSEPVLEGTVVRTANQFQGKGQMGKGWFSEPNKNLALSIVLKPQEFNTNNLYLLNMAIALAVHNFISMYELKPDIKWPNDIYVDGKKLAGILIENVWKGNTVEFSIVGLGININQEQFPQDLPNPTSLLMQKGEAIDLELAYQKLIWQVEQWYLRFKREPQKIKASYLSALLYFEERRNYTAGEERFGGRIIDVSDAGKLVLETADGLRSFGLKEISF